MATTTTQQTTQFPSYMDPYAKGYLEQAGNLANDPYQAYTGPGVVDMNPWQTNALNAMYSRGMAGSEYGSMAQQTGMDLMSDQWRGASKNPNAGNLNAATNPYANHQNPYLQQQINYAQNDVVNAWNNVQKPAWDTQMSQSGSFGNAGVAAANGLASNEMQKNLGRISSDMRMGAYNTAANLSESGAARKDAMTALGANLGESWAGRNDGMYNADRNRALSALGFAPQFQGMDYADINAALGAGNMYGVRDQALEDWKYGQWQQGQNYGWNQLQNYGNALGTFTGSMNTTTTQQGPQPNPWAQAMGGALTASSLYDYWRK